MPKLTDLTSLAPPFTLALDDEPTPPPTTTAAPPGRLAMGPCCCEGGGPCFCAACGRALAEVLTLRFLSACFSPSRTLSIPLKCMAPTQPNYWIFDSRDYGSGAGSFSQYIMRCETDGLWLKQHTQVVGIHTDTPWVKASTTACSPKLAATWPGFPNIVELRCSGGVLDPDQTLPIYYDFTITEP